MKSSASLRLVLACWLVVFGCHGSSDAPSSSDKGNTANSPILGKWASSTSPEMASDRVTMTFLESGEYQYGGPLLLFGKRVTGTVDGKEVAARLNASGVWDVKGDRLRARITQTDQQSISFEEPWDYKILNIDRKKLILETEDGKVVALFRLE